jgi:ribosomal protein S18 acetylase RimI-like enzyme
MCRSWAYCSAIPTAHPAPFFRVVAQCFERFNQGGVIGMSKVIWRDSERGHSIQYRRVPSDALMQLLEKTEWGAQGTTYAIRQVPDILGRIRDPHYLTLESDAGALIGGVVCGRKSTATPVRSCPAIHIAMVAIDKAWAGQGKGLLLSRHAKDFIFDLLGEAGLVHVYIEASNSASVNLHRRIGYSDLFTARVRFFGRFAPEAAGGVRLLEEVERCELVRALNAQYDGHIGVDFDQSVDCGVYYVLAEQGAIVAGVQISDMHWSLREIDGFAGVAALNILPNLPFMSQIYDPEHFRFLRFGSIHVKAGFEDRLSVLLESVLALRDRHVGMLLFDPRSSLQRSFEARIHFGIPAALSEFPMDVMIASKGFTEEEEQWVRSAPFHISPMDVI